MECKGPRHQCSGPEVKGGGEVGPDGGIGDRCYGNRRQTDKVKERRAPSNVMGRAPGAWHFAPPGKITSGERRAEGLADAVVNYKLLQ